ncbi:UNVERIFIED_CONTAM: hypothetical protein Sradi_7264000 [Sesamum radiatum]|uniref:Uncharacterized protein n=1 Tax=Sesamum radiatum TaxID=300843 RepID=A0AAW2IJQ9_SESRA
MRRQERVSVREYFGKSVPWTVREVLRQILISISLIISSLASSKGNAPLYTGKLAVSSNQ